MPKNNTDFSRVKCNSYIIAPWEIYSQESRYVIYAVTLMTQLWGSKFIVIFSFLIHTENFHFVSTRFIHDSRGKQKNLKGGLGVLPQRGFQGQRPGLGGPGGRRAPAENGNFNNQIPYRNAF